MKYTRIGIKPRSALLAALGIAATLLSSCGSMYPSSGRQYGHPQTAGWTTTPGIREAEQKSISRDMPFAAVSASGDIVQR